NGTFVNGRRIDGEVRVTRRDRVTLGQRAVLPWPEEIAPAGPRVIRVGRAPDNDVVLENLSVSAHHARITLQAGQAVIEDLGSSNGTAVGHPSRRVTRAPLGPQDMVYFGSFEVPASRLLPGGAAAPVRSSADVAFGGEVMVFGRHPGCDQVLDYPMIS